MSDGWPDLLRSLFDAVRDVVARDAKVREAVRAIAHGVLAELARPETQQSAPSASPEQPQSVPPPVPDVPTVAPAPALEPREAMTLRIGDAVASVQAKLRSPEREIDYTPRVVAEPAPLPTGERVFDLSLIARRAHLKADAARWASERRQRLDADADSEGVLARDRQLFTDAKTVPNCYLWMMDPRGPLLPEDDALNELAGNYEAIASAAEVLVQIDQNGRKDAADFERDAFDLAAEAQSALRVALERVDRTLIDADQDEMFGWLRGEASEWRRAIRIERYMRRDDGADPSQWMSRVERIESLRASLESQRKHRDERRRGLGKVRYHADRIRRDGQEQDWTTLLSAVETLVADGLPASDRELREHLLPLLDDLPDRPFGPGATSVLAECDRYLEQIEREPQQIAQRAPTATVERTRQMLAGKVVVLIGGYVREPQRRKIEAAFELAELRWISVLHGQSLESELFPQFRRPETALFITMTRFSSHQFGPQVRAWCREFGKAYVELPAGYGVEQIAHQVIAQGSNGLQQTGQ